MASTWCPELLARAGARPRWRGVAGVLPLLTAALLWAWVIAGVLGPLGGAMAALEGSPAPRQPARAAMIACAPQDGPSVAGDAPAAAARLRQR